MPHPRIGSDSNPAPRRSLLRRLDLETAGADSREVLEASDQRDLVPRGREQRPDPANDAASSVDDGSQKGRSPFMVTRLPERVCGQ
jgi:hypothetical protein